MSDKDTLMPCPFCGHTTQHFTFDQNEYGQSWEIICEGCGVTISVCDSQEEAIERWNTRAHRDAQTVKSENDLMLTCVCGANDRQLPSAVELADVMARAIVAHGNLCDGVWREHLNAAADAILARLQGGK